MALVITRDGRAKSLPFHAVSRCEVVQVESASQLLLHFAERQYEVRGEGERLGRVVAVYQLWRFFQDYKEVP
jgi:hypothetical protein